MQLCRTQHTTKVHGAGVMLSDSLTVRSKLDAGALDIARKGGGGGMRGWRLALSRGS